MEGASNELPSSDTLAAFAADLTSTFSSPIKITSTFAAASAVCGNNVATAVSMAIDLAILSVSRGKDLFRSLGEDVSSALFGTPSSGGVWK
jgi:hypothetical protein